jgi:hypothetical protein
MDTYCDGYLLRQNSEELETCEICGKRIGVYETVVSGSAFLVDEPSIRMHERCRREGYVPIRWVD